MHCFSMFITALCVIFLSTTKIIGYYKMNFFYHNLISRAFEPDPFPLEMLKLPCSNPVEVLTFSGFYTQLLKLRS